MQRLRFYDCRISRLPGLIGLCQEDIPQVADAVNSAQERLLKAREAGDEGWWGTWAEMVVNVPVDNPFITTPRSVARVESMVACNHPIPVQNQFYEYLNFGNGRLTRSIRHRHEHRITQAVTRNNVVTFTDLAATPQLLRAYITDAADIGKRILFQGTNASSAVIYSQDGQNQVTGIFMAFDQPFSTTPFTFKTLTGIQKDITVGDVQIFQVDPTTGDQVLLLTMEPSEQTASYRRYYLDRLPCGCCSVPSNICAAGTAVQVFLLAKLELIPVRVDTDYCLLQNREAIIEECQSIRYSGIDTPAAKQMAHDRHRDAIGFLNGELTHYLGVQTPAVEVSPFGSAKLSHQKIGSLI